MSDDYSEEYPGKSETLPHFAHLDVSELAPLAEMNLAEELAPLSTIDMSELAPLAGTNLAEELAPLSTVDTSELAWLSAMDISEALAPLSTVNMSEALVPLSEMDMSEALTPLNRIDTSEQLALATEVGIAGQVGSSLGSTDYDQNRLDESSGTTSIETESTRRLEIEIEQFIYQFHARLAFQRTYEALQVAGGKVDEKYLLFIMSGLIGGLTRFLPAKQAWGAYILGNMLAIAYYKKAHYDEE